MTYCANAPLSSEPRVTILGLAGFLGSDCIVRAITRSSILDLLTFDPTETINPQTSAPCIRGKFKGAPDQLPPACDLCFEYQAVLVFISVLLIPAAATFIKTSSSYATGTGISVLYSNFSKPP